MGQNSTTTVVTSIEQRGKAKLVQPGNREWATVIQGVNSLGWAIPPFIILAGKNHLSSWYENSPLPKDWAISVTENGWTTNERGLEWIQHFDKHTRLRRTSGYCLLILDGHDATTQLTLSFSVRRTTLSHSVCLLTHLISSSHSMLDVLVHLKQHMATKSAS